MFASLVLALAPLVLADDAADAIIDKGIRAMGGEATLAKAKAQTSKVIGTFALGDDAFEFKIDTTAVGLDRMRSTFERDFGGQKYTMVTVIDGDKGWRKEGEMEAIELDEGELADDTWGRFSQSMDFMLVELKGKGSKFRTEAVGDEKVGDKLAAGVRVTGPDDKYFTVYFDKQSGLPVKVVVDLPDPEAIGQEVTEETYFSDYEDFGGIKQPKKLEMKRDGQTFIKIELLDFKVLDKVEDKMFAKPENGDFEKAIADFDEAIRLDPKNSEAFMARGSAWYA